MLRRRRTWRAMLLGMMSYRRVCAMSTNLNTIPNCICPFTTSPSQDDDCTRISKSSYSSKGPRVSPLCCAINPI